MKKVVLEKLKCYETEDLTGADECRLEVFVDGAFQSPPLRRDLSDRQVWRLNRSHTFGSKVELRLRDEDSPDPDGLLGRVSIGANLKRHATASFTGDDASYELWYSVIDAPEPAVDPVQEAIRKFDKSTRTGVWPYIPKEELIADISRTVANPFNVAQGRTPLCGPAAIVFELASKHPNRYVEICQELYETGKFQARTEAVEPSETLVKSRASSGITLADWMLMATLRDTENAVFPLEAGSGQFVMGLTSPWEMKGWTFELLGYDNVGYESLYVYGDFEAMRKAKQVRDRGGVAFLMIHTAMLGKAEPLVTCPNHWVSLLGGLFIDKGVWYRWDSGHVKLGCYSWGRRYYVDLGEGPFEDYIWGVVFGEH